jgi:hypothetical protein
MNAKAASQAARPSPRKNLAAIKYRPKKSATAGTSRRIAATGKRQGGKAPGLLCGRREPSAGTGFQTLCLFVAQILETIADGEAQFASFAAVLESVSQAIEIVETAAYARARAIPISVQLNFTRLPHARAGEGGRETPYPPLAKGSPRAWAGGPKDARGREPNARRGPETPDPFLSPRARGRTVPKGPSGLSKPKEMFTIRAAPP